MTKTEYREYIGSADWQQRRKDYLNSDGRKCARCEIPRWLAVIAYDQDLHVHHRSYSNLGRETPDDLEPLCRRCHEIETFGRSDLRAPKSFNCYICDRIHWNPWCEICELCVELMRAPLFTRLSDCHLRFMLEDDADVEEYTVEMMEIILAAVSQRRPSLSARKNCSFEAAINAS